jgi:hypothetical protein
MVLPTNLIGGLLCHAKAENKKGDTENLYHH